MNKLSILEPDWCLLNLAFTSRPLLGTSKRFARQEQLERFIAGLRQVFGDAPMLNAAPQCSAHRR
jgi:hypothetical protein